MSVQIWNTIVKKAFINNQSIKHGNPKCLSYSATPEAAITAPIGTLCWDYTNEDAYINDDGATSWVKLNA